MTKVEKHVPNEWLVDEWIKPGETCGLFGEPKSYKSFVLLDIGLSVACGRPWHGSGTTPGRTLFIDGQRTATLPLRIRAWCEHNAVSSDALDFGVVTTFAQLTNAEKMQELARVIQGNESLVILDLSTPLDLDSRSVAEYAASIGEALDRFHHSFAGALCISVGTYSPASPAASMLRLDRSVAVDPKAKGSVTLTSLSGGRATKHLVTQQIKIDEDWTTLVLDEPINPSKAASGAQK